MSNSNTVYITECPRDAMQGVTAFIPTEEKIAYIQKLLEVGFDMLDFGSFVSPKAIPQLKDTKQVYQALNLSQTNTKLLAIVANLRGVEQALEYEGIEYLGFPFSASETFQKRNTNKTLKEALKIVEEAYKMCCQKGKKLNVYISMAFGNPYGDEYSIASIQRTMDALVNIGISNLALADTIGVATPYEAKKLLKIIINMYHEKRISAHVHVAKDNATEMVKAILASGCKHLDTSINGVGGCPMAKEELIGNLATQDLLSNISHKDSQINMKAFKEAQSMASELFSKYY